MSTQRIYRTDPTQWTPHVFGAAAAAWVKNTAYVVGILVTSGGSTYFCQVAHTSTNDDNGFAPDLAAGKWLLVTTSVWTPQNEGTGKGRISAIWDRGAGDLPFTYQYNASTRWAATPAAGDQLRLYLLSSLASATAALTDGAFAPGDAEITTEVALANNCRYQLRGPVASAVDQLYLRSGTQTILPRYLVLGAWNGSATKALTNTASDHWVMFRPTADAIQPPS